jgi:hypothetical protein
MDPQDQQAAPPWAQAIMQQIEEAAEAVVKRFSVLSQEMFLPAVLDFDDAYLLVFPAFRNQLKKSPINWPSNTCSATKASFKDPKMEPSTHLRTLITEPFACFPLGC